MGKSLNSWLSKPVFIYTFGLFFLIYKTVEFFPSFQFTVFILSFLVYFIINYLVILLLKRTGLIKYGSGWLIIVWIAVLFSDPVISFFSKFISPAYFAPHYLPLLLVLPGLLLIWLRRKISERNILLFNRLFNVFIFILIGFAVISGINIRQYENAHDKKAQARVLPGLGTNNVKDIIWILMDEYAAPANLKSQFNYHDDLVDSLKARNFFVFDLLATRSDRTVYSVNSLFNLDDSIPTSNYLYAANYLNKSSWVKKLSINGYNFVNLDFFDIAGHSKFSYLPIYPDNYCDQLFINSLIAPLTERISKADKMPIDSYNGRVIGELIKQANAKKTGPTFIWAHLLIPHAPFYRDEKGTIVNDPVEDPERSASSSKVSRQYTGYLSYGNNVILNILKKIPGWKDKTIVISGDHGARMLIPPHDRRRTETFAAIYSPGMDENELKTIKYLQQIPFHLH